VTLAAGSRLGPYEIVAPLGAGGMGEVYRARDTRLDRIVAIKVLPARLAGDPDALQRFEREARAVAALSHPNILAIHDFGDQDGTAYAVTELLEGKTLRERLEGPLPARKAVEYAVQVALGLAAAHDKGIVHRDLKPENIFVTDDGRVKILDFGLARLQSPVVSSAPLTEAPTTPVSTEPGVVMGTVGYMSPEQVRGYGADHRSDLFAFGAVLYEMLTGRRAFRGVSAADTMSAVLNAEPELAPAFTTTEPALTQIVRRCLEKSPGERFQSAQDLAFALGSLSNSSRARAVPRLSIRPRRIAVAAVAALAILLAAFALFSRVGGRGQRIDSLAVLPFANASADPESEYLSDGITETLINKLSQLPDVRVISRASVFRYKGKDADPATIARELGVRAVVTGRVTQRGDGLSMAVELVDARDKRQLWGERYDRKLADVLTVQEDIAKQISDMLRVRLTGEEQARLAKNATANPEAYQAYLKGFHHARKVTIADLEKGMGYFRQALALDPNYAPAHAGIAYTYIMWLADWYMPAREAFRQGKEAALKAIELDPSLSDGHTFLAMARFLYDYDWPGAEQEFARAIALNPADPNAHQWYAVYLGARGRFDEGGREIRRALELDPLSIETNFLGGWRFYFSRRYDEALEQIRHALELDPTYFYGYMFLGMCQEQKGQFRDAAAAFERARKLTADAGETPPEILADLVRSHVQAGDRAAAEKVRGELDALTKRRYVSRHDLSLVSLALGDRRAALDWLEKAYEDRNWYMPWIHVDPRFDPIRSEPRFVDLVRRMKLTS
jgi:eukaryotic-like serine/threonine-protein kinase